MAQVMSARQLNPRNVPELDYFLDQTKVPVYEWQRDAAVECTKPFVGLHTSGTTGIPKPVIITHGLYLAADAMSDIAVAHNLQVQSFTGERYFSPFPFFHSGSFMALCGAVMMDMVVMAMPPPFPLSGEMIAEALKATKATSAMIPPAILAAMITDPEQTKVLSELKYVLYGGGPLASEVHRRLPRSLTYRMP